MDGLIVRDPKLAKMRWMSSRPGLSSMEREDWRSIYWRLPQLEPRRDGMSLILLSLVAATCAVIVAVVFVMAWRDEDVVVTVVLGVTFFVLALAAISFMLASL